MTVHRCRGGYVGVVEVAKMVGGQRDDPCGSPQASEDGHTTAAMTPFAVPS